MVTSGLYALPFGNGKKFLNQGGIVNTLSGGWQLGSILTLQAGFPTTVFCGARTSNDLLNHCLPNATGQKAALPRGEQDPERFFNTAAYALPPFGSYGNLGRNTLIGPGLINWDFSILKTFRIREGHNLQFRFEAFNVPNHPNWDFPSTIFSSSFFGKIRTRAAICEKCSLD